MLVAQFFSVSVQPVDFNIKSSIMEHKNGRRIKRNDRKKETGQTGRQSRQKEEKAERKERRDGGREERPLFNILRKFR